MGQKKLIRFAEIATFPNVLQYPKNMRGNWHEFFGNKNPITLELACGKGEYAVGLGQLYPTRNFIGIDLKGNRIWVGAKKAIAQNLKNVAFVRSQIGMLADYFDKGEVQEIWLTFPDPQLRTSRAKKRLTHPRFLRMYQQILSDDGYINLKTDSPVLFGFTKTILDLYDIKAIEESDHVYANENVSPELMIKTHYEALDIAQSRKIHYLKFSLPSSALPDIDDALQEKIKVEETGQEVITEEPDEE
jgi:tRNA (guanine-N7-)-methyltransferase